jgi:hypothetical protein
MILPNLSNLVNLIKLTNFNYPFYILDPNPLAINSIGKVDMKSMKNLPVIT